MEATMEYTQTFTDVPRIDARDATPLLSVVGTSARLQGTFEIAEAITIECQVGGELTVGSRLVIGQSGVVTADVRTVDAVIHGHYEGNLIATGNVEIAATGHVMGNIQTDSLVIAKGGFFNGNVASSGAAPAAKAARSIHLLEERRASVAR
jgi:cytoskeletal protein CcmA (bactofilin family)